MKSLQGWTDVGSCASEDLGMFGEQVVLSVRLWLVEYVSIIRCRRSLGAVLACLDQRYTYSYRTVTGVDLTEELTDTGEADRYVMPPSVLTPQTSGHAATEREAYTATCRLYLRSTLGLRHSSWLLRP